MVLVALAVWKAWQHRGERGLMNLLAWDAIMYFIPIFAIFTATGIMWLHNDVSTTTLPRTEPNCLRGAAQIALNELLTGPAFALASILTNRLMISVRKAYYDQQDRRATGMLPTVPDIAFHVDSESGTEGEVELAVQLQSDVELVARAEIQEERRREIPSAPGPSRRFSSSAPGPSNWRRQSWADAGVREEDVGLRSYNERGGF